MSEEIPPDEFMPVEVPIVEVPIDPVEFISVTEAAAFAMISDRTMRDYYYAGTVKGWALPTKKRRGNVRISIHSLRAFMITCGIPTEKLDAKFPLSQGEK